MKTINPKSVLESIGASLLSSISEAERSSDIFVWLKNVVNEKRQPIELDNHCFLKKPYEDETEVQVYKKGAQVGVTTMVLLKSFFFAQRNQVDIISVFPTATDVRKFCQGRFDAFVGRNPLLNKYLVGLNSTEMKEIADSRIYFQGSWIERAALSIPGDLLSIDELDRCMPDVLEVYEERLAASDYKWKWFLSTPTYPKFGIDALFEKSNQCVWLVPCRHHKPLCWNEIRWPDSIKKRIQRRPRISSRIRNEDGTYKQVYPESRRTEYYFACRKCGKELDRKNGEWNARHEGEPIHGYHISQLIAPWVSANEIKDKHKNTSFKKTFWNFTLGLALAEGTGILTKEVLLKCVRNVSMLGGGESYYMGVDNSDTKNICISRTESDGFRRIVYLEETGDLKRIGQLMNTFNVRICFADALPNKDFVRGLAKKFPGRVRWIYYGNFEQIGKEGSEEGSVILNRTQVLDRVADSWIKGQNLLPQMSPIVNKFIDQLCNMVRDEKKDRHGQIKRDWLSTGPDHFRHTDAYAYMAELWDKQGGFKDSVKQEPVSVSTESEDWSGYEDELCATKY